MLRKTEIFGIISTAMLGFASLPASAQTATVQGGTQQTNIDGNNNNVTQIINQYIYTNPGRGNQRRNQATVQNAGQGTSINGSGNTVNQTIEQTNINRNRGHHNDHNHHNDHDNNGRGKKKGRN